MDFAAHLAREREEANAAYGRYQEEGFGAVGTSAEGETRPDTESRSDQPRTETPEGFGLAAQTREELAARQAELDEAAAKEERDRKAEEEAKEKAALAERQKANVNTVLSDNFQLGQSQQEVERTASTGVQDMFTASGEVKNPNAAQRKDAENVPADNQEPEAVTAARAALAKAQEAVAKSPNSKLHQNIASKRQKELDAALLEHAQQEPNATTPQSRPESTQPAPAMEGQDQAAPAKFTRQGDFWNYSGNHAEKIAKALGITVTENRDGEKMVGIPDHARARMADELQKAGIGAEFVGAGGDDPNSISIDTFNSWRKQGYLRVTSGWTLFKDNRFNEYVLMRKHKEENAAGGGYISAQSKGGFKT